MMNNDKDYQFIIVESYAPKLNKGYHGEVHIKPVISEELFTVDNLIEYKYNA